MISRCFGTFGTSSRRKSNRSNAQGRSAMRILIGLMMLALIMEGTAMAETLNFDDAIVGKSPEGWTLSMTGKGQPKWTIETEPTAPSKPNVLKQSGQATFPVAIR